MRAHAPTLRDVVADLRRVLARLERLTAGDQPLDALILDALAAAGPSSTATVRRLVARRQADVLSTLRLLQAAGRVTRRDSNWEVIE